MTKAFVALVSVLLLAIFAESPTGATPASTTPDGEVSSEEYAGLLAQLIPEPSSLHPSVLGQVSLDLGPVGRLADDMLAAHDDLVAAEASLASAQGRLEALGVRSQVLTAKIELGTATERELSAERDEAEALLSLFSVSTFVNVEDYSSYYFGGDQAEQVSLALANRSADVVEADTIAARAAHDAAVAELAAMRADLAQVGADRTTTEDEREESLAARDEARDRRDGLAPSFERALLQLTVPSTDIPVVVLDAYYRAQVATAAAQPACGLSWWHLAGIGKAESSHGSFGGNVVGGDGRTSGEILGPPLDGERFQAIPDTDGGELDGDLEWDRAVGPMQFIPTSWEIYGSDGNGDGVVDPHNIYDAALAAAKHLCGSTSGLQSEGAFQLALSGYNRSVSYGLEVMGHSAGYRAAVSLL